MEAEQKQLVCGVVAPISFIDGCDEGHWEDVREIVKEALKDSPFSVEMVSDSDDSGIIQQRIVQNIYSNDIVVCDVSGRNSNVMFELGLRIAFDKPVVIIKDELTTYSFDTAPIEHLEYRRDLHYQSIQLFKQTLLDKVTATYDKSKQPGYRSILKSFGKFIVSKIDETEVESAQLLLNEMRDLRAEFQSLKKQVQANSGAPTAITIRNAFARPTSSSAPHIKLNDLLLGIVARSDLLNEDPLGNR